MAIYAIGDIQGCYDEFKQLLNVVDFSPSRDQLWVAGDMVNRGPKSLEVLESLMSFEGAVQCVLGNHDLHLLAIAAGTRQASKKDTTKTIIDSPAATAIISWLRHQPLFFHSETHNISMVHAGIPPIWSIEKTQNLSHEVESILRSEEWTTFTAGMYGNEPKKWGDNLSGIDRLRSITNYLTRMRFCDSEGELDLEDKSHRHSQRPGFKAWFEFDNSEIKDQNHQVIFGHWAVLRGVSESSKHHALDTGCVWGGELTAMDVQTQKRFSVPAQKTRQVW